MIVRIDSFSMSNCHATSIDQRTSFAMRIRSRRCFSRSRRRFKRARSSSLCFQDLRRGSHAMLLDVLQSFTRLLIKSRPIDHDRSRCKREYGWVLVSLDGLPSTTGTRTSIDGGSSSIGNVSLLGDRDLGVALGTRLGARTRLSGIF